MLRPSIFTDNFIDNVFDDFFMNGFYPSTKTRKVNAMSTDIRDLEDAYQIDMDLPGFAKEDVQAELKDGYLTISAGHSDEREEKDNKQNYIRRERYTGSYQRSFYVGEAVTQEDIKAKFTDGVLTFVVPKKEKQPEVEQKKFIAIEG